MATVDREGQSEGEPAGAEGLATSLASASFVRILARADGDGVAAAGTLARALSTRGVPFQVATAGTAAERAARLDAGGPDEATVLVGDAPAPESVHRLPAVDGPASLSARAWRVAAGLLDGTEETPATAALALAGAVAAGDTPGTAGTAPVVEAAAPARRPGVATPTDPVDGLAHSTLVHGPFSGSPERVRETLSGVDLTPTDADGRRALASAVALATLREEPAGPAAASVERVLRPYVAGPMATLVGYADVLDAAARESPGTAVALALGHDARDPALSAWRERGRRAHEAVRSASTGRYDGLLAVRAETPAPVATVARLVAAYRSPEPVVAAVTGDRVAAAVRPDAETPAPGLAHATRTALADAAVDGSSRRAVADLPAGTEPTAFIAGLREALS